MPQYREVLTLQSLALYAIGQLVSRLASLIISNLYSYSDPEMSVEYFKRSSRQVEQLLKTNVPHYLYDSMAVHVLTTIKNLIEITRRRNNYCMVAYVYVNEAKVVTCLTEIVLTSSLKHLDFSAWPKVMRNILSTNLYKLSGLEKLNMGARAGSLHTAEKETNLINGIKAMKNLTSLSLCNDCNNRIIQELSINCPNLLSLDISSSQSVTDQCVDYLVNCKRLIRLQLYHTSISRCGFKKLIVDLPKLQDIGRCNEFGSIIKDIHEKNLIFGPLALRKFQTRYLAPDSSRYIGIVCPKVDSVGLFHETQVTDFNVLTSLDNLRALKLSLCAFYTDSVKQLLQAKGTNLCSLHLELVNEIDINAVMLISQCCPQLKSFVLYNCNIVYNDAPRPALNIKPFEFLEQLFWVVDCSVDTLEFLLSNAVNIKSIYLGSSTCITHSSLVNIIAYNPLQKLEELRILYSSDMGMRTVEIIMENCPRLKILSDLESWQGLSLDELKWIRNFIHANNYNLDVNPTLSYKKKSHF